MNNPTLGEFCFAMIGRADIEGSKSDVAMKLDRHKPVIPVVTFSDTLSSNSVIKRIDRPTFLTPRPVLKGEVKPAFALLLYARFPTK